MTEVGIAGDWHGDTMSAIAMLKILHSHGITEVYHVGDFGVYGDRDGEKYLRAVTRQLEMYDMTCFVTEGNHEDFGKINSIPVSEDGKQWVTERISLLPRGYRWEQDGHSFVSFGGAASINFTSLKKDISWWSEEAITAGDVYRLGAGGEADVMISHDAPLNIPTLETMKEATSSDWAANELEYAYQSQLMMTYAVEAVRPKLFFHGHYHLGYVEEVLFIDQYGEGFSTTVYGMDMNRHQRNIGILDCETLAFEWAY